MWYHTPTQTQTQGTEHHTLPNGKWSVFNLFGDNTKSTMCNKC